MAKRAAKGAGSIHKRTHTRNGKEYTYRVLSKNFTCYNSNFNITPSSFYFGIDVSVTNQAVTVSGVADTY